MKPKRITFYCLATLVAGCFPIVSLSPLVTKETLTFDENLLGTWVEDVNDPNTASYWEFAHFEKTSVERLPKDLQGESKQIYRLNLSDRAGRKGVLVACLVTLGNRRFLDVFLDQLPCGESDPNKIKLMYNAMFLVPSHMFFRVDAIGDQLKMGITFDEQFKKLMEAEPKAVPYVMTERGPVLTASTKELQAFVTKYGDDERLFLSPITLTRKAK